MKKIIFGMLVLSMMFVFTSCFDVEGTVDQQQRQETQQQLSEMNKQIGMPAINNFYEKKMQKEIFELRDRADLITYLYSQNREGKFIYIGRGMGFGLPESVQYTNPEYIASSFQGGYAILPQADPNGLFMPENLSGAWYPLINEETGKTELLRMEQTMLVTQSKLPKRLVADWSLTEDY